MLDLLASNPVARFAFLALIFGLITISVVWLGRGASRRSDVKNAIGTIAGGSAHGPRQSLQERRTSAWSDLADRIEKAGLSLTDTRDDKLREKLVAAGYTSPSATKVFTLVRLLSIFAMPLGYILVAEATGRTFEGNELVLWGGGMAILGFYLPTLIVTAKADRRREEITNGFPDCLDLLLVCVEAGLGLEAAMDRVGREMVTSHPLVAQLLSATTLRLRAGARREEALRRMGESSGVAEIKSFATLLIQSDKLGTSVADTLRVYASEMREKRRLRAEEKAHKLPVIISIPLVVCMLPVMVGVLMLPGVVNVARVLVPAMGG